MGKKYISFKYQVQQRTDTVIRALNDFALASTASIPLRPPDTA